MENFLLKLLKNPTKKKKYLFVFFYHLNKKNKQTKKVKKRKNRIETMKREGIERETERRKEKRKYCISIPARNIKVLNRFLCEFPRGAQKKI